MSVVGMNHAQVNVSQGDVAGARDFYLNFLGLKEISRPPVFRSEGFWVNAGSFELHIGVEEGHDRRQTRAHMAYEVSDIQHWRRKVESAGYQIGNQPKIPGYERFHFRDPFGNNLELIQRTES